MSLKSRIGVVICSITATVYYGGLCTQKYISNPVTVVDEIVPMETLPPLKWSICKQVTLTECTSPVENNLYYYEYYFFSSNSYYIDYEDEYNDTTTSPVNHTSSSKKHNYEKFVSKDFACYCLNYYYIIVLYFSRDLNKHSLFYFHVNRMHLQKLCLF